MRRKTRNSPVAEEIFQRRQAQKEAERRRQEAAAYRTPEQLAEAAELRRRKMAAEAERKASHEARVNQLAHEVIELLEEFGYPNPEFLDLEERVWFGLIRQCHSSDAR